MRDPPAIEVHLLDIEKPTCITAAPEICDSTAFGLIALPQSTTLTSLRISTMPGLGIDLNLGATARDQPERCDFRALPIDGTGRT